MGHYVAGDRIVLAGPRWVRVVIVVGPEMIVRCDEGEKCTCEGHERYQVFASYPKAR